MTNKKEALASVLPDIVKYVIEHEDEIPSYMKDAFTQEPSLEDNEVKDFQDGGPVSSTGVIRDEFGNFIPAPRVVGGRPVNPNAKKVFLKPDIPEGSNVESPFEGTPVSSIYAGIEYDDQGRPVVDSSFPMDREQQAALDSQLNVDAMSDDAFIDHFGPGLMNIGIIEQIKGQLGKLTPVLEKVPSIPPAVSLPIAVATKNPVSAFVTTVALIGDKLSKSLARGALNNKYSNPDERMNILQGVVSKLSPKEDRQDVEFATRAVNTPMDTSLQDYERAEQQVGIPTAPAAPAAPAPSAPSLEQAAADIALDTDVGERAGIDVGMGAPDVDVSAPDVSAPDAPDSHGGLNKGGPVNMQIGGEVDNADTNMEVANMPMGVVGDMDGAPAPFNGGTGVEDDLDMEVEAGSYILNAEAVQLIGISDINKVIRDAYTIAARLGKPMPEDYDPQNKVPIRISNGEAVVPKALVDIIGLDKLEKWNQKGLELRKQKEEVEAEQQQAQAQQPQVASEAPMQQQMGQLMDKGGEVEEDFFKIDLDFIRKLDSWMDKYNKTRTNKKNYLNTNNALILAETIAMQESDSDPDARQDPRGVISGIKNLIKTGSIYGPGSGLYQYEKEGSDKSTQEAAKTAVTRAKSFDPNMYWLSKFDDEVAKRIAAIKDPRIKSLVEAEMKNDNDEDFDLRRLTGKEQTELFIIDHLLGDAPFIDTVNNDNLTGKQAFEYWKKYHWRGKDKITPERKQEFINNYNKNKNKVYKVLRRGEN